MWKFRGDQMRPLTKEEKTVLWPGATCVLRSLYTEFEEMDIDKIPLGVELLDRLGHTNRSFFAAETFLMLFDDRFVIPTRAVHEAFAVAFCMHTAAHVIEDNTAGEVLRSILYPILKEVEIFEERSELNGPQDSRKDVWADSVADVAAILVPDYDYELSMFFIGEEYEIDAMKLLAKGTKRPAFYFAPYAPEYIAGRIDDYVKRTQNILTRGKESQKALPK